MAKFKILVETKQLWEVEAEAETAEDAKKIRDDFYEEIQEQCEGLVLQFQQTHPHEIKLAEFFGGDDFSDDDIKAIQDLTQIKTTKAFRSEFDGYVDTAFCPYCGAENTGEITIKKGHETVEKNKTIIEIIKEPSSSFDTDEANAKMFECNCFHCGLLFRVDYFKEV